MKKYLIIITKTPFKSSIALEGQELSLALAAFGQDVSLCFCGTGVLQLIANKKGENILYKDFTKTYTGLELFDIKQVYIQQEALEKYKLSADKLKINAELVSNSKISELFKQHDIVLTV
jgi:tRNA 2-thiouridine synthesizing protein C